LEHDFYVGDLLTEENTLEKASSFRNELIDIITKGGLELK
jgi:hypothetical protein